MKCLIVTHCYKQQLWCFGMKMNRTLHNPLTQPICKVKFGAIQNSIYMSELMMYPTIIASLNIMQLSICSRRPVLPDGAFIYHSFFYLTDAYYFTFIFFTFDLFPERRWHNGNHKTHGSKNRQGPKRGTSLERYN